jgi:hypothetical protein
MKALLQKLQPYKWYLLFFLFFIPTIVYLFSFAHDKQPHQQAPGEAGRPQSSFPTPTALPTRFSITKTSPVNGATDIPATEITVSFTTNVPIQSPDAFHLQISPALQYDWQFLNTYPTTEVKALALGGLQPSTAYTVTVTNKENAPVSSWSFTTSSIPAQSHSATRNKLDQDINAQYYPLTTYLPYSTTDFTVQEYTDHLTLQVLVKSADTEKVKTEVTDWIRSKGVDPSTHTINYTPE